MTRITKGTNKEIKSLYEALKQKKHDAGEPYTQQKFVEDLHLTDRRIYAYWVSDPQHTKPTKQSIYFMNELAKKEGI